MDVTKGKNAACRNQKSIFSHLCFHDKPGTLWREMTSCFLKFLKFF